MEERHWHQNAHMQCTEEDGRREEEREGRRGGEGGEEGRGGEGGEEGRRGRKRTKRNNIVVRKWDGK